MALDLFVVLIYAAGMLVLGYYGMRRAKTHEDYLVAGRNLGPSLYMGTMAATVLGGASTVGTVRLGYVHGISGFWLCAALGMGIIALNLFLAKPLLKLKIFTVTQVLEKRYNPMARQASAVIMLAYALMIGVTSILAIGTVLQVLFGLPFWISVLLGGGVVVMYSTIGGMWSLTLTDIVQFVIKTVGLMFILLPICLYRVGGWDELVAKLPASNFSFTAIGWDTIITYFMIYFFGILIGQDIWQRVFTARDEKVAQYAGTFAGFYCILYGLACALIGMAAHVLIPDLDNVNNAFAAIVKVSLPDGIRGLVNCGGVGGDDVDGQRRLAGGVHRVDRGPAATFARRQAVEPEHQPPVHPADRYRGAGHRAGGERCDQCPDPGLQPAGGRHADPADRGDFLEARDDFGGDYVHDPGLRDGVGVHVQGRLGREHADLLQPGGGVGEFCRGEPVVAPT